MTCIIRPRVAALAFTAAAAAASPAIAVPVDLELLFINDVSGSITGNDFDFYISGYADAFRDAGLVSQIENGAIGSIAVSLAFFSNDFQQTIGWTQIGDAASAEAFAQTVEGVSRPGLGSSDFLVTAVNAAAGLFDGNGFEGTRNVIDVVTEGAAQDGGCSFNVLACPGLQDARDAALAGSVDGINALFLDDRDFFGNDPEDIINAAAYGDLNLIGGPGAFSIVIEDFTEFSAAIRNKLEREITPPPPDGVIPLPAAAPLFALGLAALGGLGLRRRFG